MHAIPETLRFHPALPHTKNKPTLPAMVAAVQDINGTVVAIHRTFLRADGSGKADVDDPKKMLGPVRGCAVRLTEAGQRLVVGEGIESSLPVLAATGLPTWAALSASGIVALELPPLPLAGDIIVASFLCRRNAKGGT